MIVIRLALVLVWHRRRVAAHTRWAGVAGMAIVVVIATVVVEDRIEPINGYIAPNV